ncbi:Sortase [Bifidobacterium callimiconis]|uniref:Sortase n=2 Tax=Bifidobacterium callimiconis TaxID=2306973 RepID=A0A430FEI2_9BIFI|nr:Sortase [Bifidobacterium callimiconis]
MDDFYEIIHPSLSRIERRRERRRRVRDRILTAATALLFAAATLVVGIPAAQSVGFAADQSQTTQRLSDAMDAMDSARRTRMLTAADAYNRRLARTGQPIIGEAADPFSGKATGDFTGSDDPDYERTLDTGRGVMGSISIPKIGVDLTIRHGSGAQALETGIGHLHGTSLPVGGTSTHAALTGHRGLPNAELFTRLDEIRLGDPFYLHVLGTTLAYRVTDIRVVDPDQVDSLKIVPGKDLVTLVTCTPYGVNTQRLLVTGERARIGVQVPAEADAPGDARPLLAAGVGLPLLVGLPLARRASRRETPQHHSTRKESSTS